jgi:hypothetical protein
MGDFAWVPFGPADKDGPSAWYRALEDGKCADVKNDANDTLVRAAAAICRAAVDKQRSEWDVAQKLNAQGLKNSGAAPCLDAAAVAMVQRALAWHANNPNADPTVVLPQSGQPVACEFKIIKINPAEGPLAGGTRIEIMGPGLNDVEQVLIGDVPADIQERRIGDLSGARVDIVTVNTPPGKQPGPVDVSVRNRAGTAVAPGGFTYTTTTPTPSTSNTPTPTASGSAGPLPIPQTQQPLEVPTERPS